MVAEGCVSWQVVIAVVAAAVVAAAVVAVAVGAAAVSSSVSSLCSKNNSRFSISVLGRNKIIEEMLAGNTKINRKMNVRSVEHLLFLRCEKRAVRFSDTLQCLT